ncbi:MAG: sugar kinase [Spirochaetales bacterium]|uniref:Sugar kinase n=1 Tax=Candidatus Thalassospirochaeta sargassi TaxID=3119039 RepID=A0AAJ1IEP0_9SPIO|nr:sugar kinase [Spirochaetales bacterium]
MSNFNIKPSSQCKWDAAALGEIMLRLDPGDGRIRNTREFRVWEGGGEYNVIRGLHKCFKLDTAVVTGIPGNDLGLLLEDLISQGGVNYSYSKWFDFDGIGRNYRQGLNFVEKGFGVRGALGVSDRAHTAAAGLKPGDIDWKSLFVEDGVRWFHTGGIYAALSETAAELTIEAMKAAKAAGTTISYDLNYRPSLWKTNGGQAKAQEINREIAKYVDVMIGNEEDFSAALGFKLESADKGFKGLDIENYKSMIRTVAAEYPNFKAIATTLRDVVTATVNDWSAILYTGGEFYRSIERPALEIYDRVGGGDSFASGLIYGFLAGKSPEEAVNYGAAHGALAMTTPGDTSMASLKEVEKLATGGNARVER